MRIRKIRGSFSPKPSSICRIMSIPVIRHIYVIQRSILRLERMSDKKNEFVPAQKFIGMQVIDSKGSAVGTVRDLGINVGEKKFNLIVTTKTRSDVQVSWEDIQSVVDVILLRKEIEIPKIAESATIPFLRPRRSAIARIAEHRSSQRHGSARNAAARSPSRPRSRFLRPRRSAIARIAEHRSSQQHDSARNAAASSSERTLVAALAETSPS